MDKFWFLEFIVIQAHIFFNMHFNDTISAKYNIWNQTTIVIICRKIMIGS